MVGGEVVTGVLDKNAFGKYGLVHAIQELYGAPGFSRRNAPGCVYPTCRAVIPEGFGNTS